MTSSARPSSESGSSLTCALREDRKRMVCGKVRPAEGTLATPNWRDFGTSCWQLCKQSLLQSPCCKKGCEVWMCADSDAGGEGLSTREVAGSRLKSNSEKKRLVTRARLKCRADRRVSIFEQGPSQGGVV
jgi:hypothetical protein